MIKNKISFCFFFYIRLNQSLKVNDKVEVLE